jgi:hypothetical protein
MRDERRAGLLRTRDDCVPNRARDASVRLGRASVAGMNEDENPGSPLDEGSRRLRSRGCAACCEREPGRLQLRLVVDVNELMHDIVVEENDDSVVVEATVCGPVAGLRNDLVGAPFHVYLERPLRGRRVIDALSGRDVPYRNVLAELAAEYGLEHGGGPKHG